MITRKDIMNEVQSRGYQIEACDKVKNGVTIDGIGMLKWEDVGIFIPVNEILKWDENTLRGYGNEKEHIQKIADRIINMYETCDECKMRLEDLKNRDYILGHINIGLQKTSTQDFVKKPCPYFDKVEEYLYISQEDGTAGRYYMPVKENLLEQSGVSESEAWEAAKKNLHDNVVLETMQEALEAVAGIKVDFLFLEEEFPMYIMSNKYSMYGASSVLDNEILKQLALDCGTDTLVLIPASIHEVLIFPNTEDYSVDEMRMMVMAVNAEEVAPQDQLSDEPYLWKLEN